MIVAASNNGVIGYKNKIPWNIPEDFKNFKRITTNNMVIMGKKTFDSIGFKEGLPNRFNVILSKDISNKNIECGTVKVLHSVKQVIEFGQNVKTKKFVIGGAQIYKQFMPYIETIHLSRIGGQWKGDSFIDLQKMLSNYTLVDDETKVYHDFSYEVYKRN